MLYILVKLDSNEGFVSTCINTLSKKAGINYETLQNRFKQGFVIHKNILTFTQDELLKQKRYPKNINMLKNQSGY